MTLSHFSELAQPFALATVVGVRGSAPRPLGAKLGVDQHGRMVGGVSGGCVESAVAAAAQEVLVGGRGALLRFGASEDQTWEVGLPCGEIDVLVERPAAHVASFLRRPRGDVPAALVSVVAGDDRDTALGTRLLISADGGVQGALSSRAQTVAATTAATELLHGQRSATVDVDCMSLFVDVMAPPPRLVISGAVEIAAPLSLLAAQSGWRVYVIEPRSAFALAGRLPVQAEILGEWPDAALAALAPIDAQTFVVALSHDAKIDDELLAGALRAGAGFVGAMGSRRSHAARLQRLHERGLTSQQCARISAPLGLDLGATGPFETAISMMAEIVAVRNGRGGGRLSQLDVPIHARRP